MKLTSTFTVRLLAFIFAYVFVAPSLAAPPPPLYIQFSPSATKGALYYPDPALFPAPHIAVIIMHRNSNYLSHLGTREFPKRGFVALGMNPRCDNNEALCRPWENNALDVKSGVEFLRKLPGITKIILFGHSGGGPTMSFYQAVAENGVGFCQDPRKLVRCGNGLAGLPQADGIVLMDAHPGNGVNALRSLNPAVTNDSAVLNQNRPAQINPALDPGNPKNGFNPDGSSTYSESFKKAYFKAQADRMNFLIAEALNRMQQIEAGTYKYPDDDAFIVPHADGARLMEADLSIHHSTLKPRKLVKNDGTIESCCAVESVRVPSFDPEASGEFGSTIFLTLRSFLSVRAMRSTDSMDGIDWCSSNNSTPCNLQKVTIPLLVTAMGAHYFIRDSEQFFDMAASADKDFLVIEGASHGGTPCTACEQFPGQYSNTVKNLFDQIASWINARF
ncbi:MAG TPA: hypothetical protein VJQ55_07500 [Candidatus Binatia bacterium]|nr:hypothetical protein [Candidatus Binatia bacterium]